MHSIHALVLLAPLSVLAQSALPTEFPAGSTPITGDALQARLSGKVFTVKPADGSTWKLEYKANGYLFLESSGGYKDTGTWRIEGEQTCGTWQKAGRSCTEYRLKDDALFAKRQSGEIIRLVSE
jgi:hypothetical protein